MARVLSYQWRGLPQVSFLLRQNFCRQTRVYKLMVCTPACVLSEGLPQFNQSINQSINQFFVFLFFFFFFFSFFFSNSYPQQGDIRQQQQKQRQIVTTLSYPRYLNPARRAVNPSHSVAHARVTFPYNPFDLVSTR